MSDYLLTQIINYGAPLFGLILLLAAIGIPFPASLLLIAAGAFSQQGILDAASTALFGFLGAVTGDAISFGMGYYAKDWVDKRFEGSPAWKGAQISFTARAGMAVYLTRFLVTALAVPTNLIAAGSGYRLRNFMAYDTAGEATWVILYGGLGYWFGSEWEVVSDFISNFGGLLLGLVILVAGIVLAIRWLRTGTAHSQSVPRSSENIEPE
jgi:membrane protein DedA with SNARE-associated domain